MRTPLDSRGGAQAREMAVVEVLKDTDCTGPAAVHTDRQTDAPVTAPPGGHRTLWAKFLKKYSFAAPPPLFFYV